MVLDENNKKLAIMYVAATGFYKTRLAEYLGISRPTLDKILENDSQFFTALKAADAVFCKNLIINTAKKNPAFLLKTKYGEEFNENKPNFDPVGDLNKIMKKIDEMFTSETSGAGLIDDVD